MTYNNHSQKSRRFLVTILHLKDIESNRVYFLTGADVITPMESIYIGGIAGVLVVLAVLIIDSRLKLDDPVGATSVHLVCGIWGTLAAGIWGEGKSFLIQLAGVSSVGVFCMIVSLGIFLAIKYTIGLRVSPAEESRGLDIGEHGSESYAGFQIFITQ